jgi:hypothetical protein
MGEAGEIIAGGNTGVPLRKAGDLASEYGGQASDWVKKTRPTLCAGRTCTCKESLLPYCWWGICGISIDIRVYEIWKWMFCSNIIRQQPSYTYADYFI